MSTMSKKKGKIDIFLKKEYLLYNIIRKKIILNCYYYKLRDKYIYIFFINMYFFNNFIKSLNLRHGKSDLNIIETVVMKITNILKN